MTTEENKRMLALSYIVADLKAENTELVQRVHQLMGDYNDVVHQLNGKEARNYEDSSKQTLIEMRKMRDLCNKLELDNVKLKRIAKEIHTFVKDKKLYAKKGEECPYDTVITPICSTYCLECSSCLGVIEGLGVICKKRLAEASVHLPVAEN